MRCQLVDALEWVYPDSEIGRQPCRSRQIDVARGGTVAVHVLVNEAQPGTRIRLALSHRDSGRPGYFRLIAVPVEVNTGPVGFTEKDGEHNDAVTRRAPFRVYDAMQPIGAALTVGAPTEAIRVHFPIARDAKPGKREWLLTLSCGKETHTLKLGVTIHKALIPPVGGESWAYTNWFSLGNMASRHGLKEWSEAHWSMIRAYARLMARNRQNMFWFTFKDVFQVTKTGLHLDRERLRRLVKIFSQAGMHYIEGGHFGGRTKGDWLSPTFSVSLTNNPATSPEGDADIAQAAGQLMSEIYTNGWQDRYLQHVTDEPTSVNAADYRIFVGMVRKYMPGIPIVDATMDTSLAGSVDIWCPQAQHYQQHRDQFEATRARGDRLWFYTCCFPGGPWLNRLLDMELIRPALLGWGAARFRLDGFLHWGLNHYRQDQDPFKMNVVPNWGGGTNALPAGDTHVVYPGADGPWSSVRMEAQREGLEDLELLRRLDRISSKQTDAITQSVIRGFDDYTTDLRVFRAARRRLLARSD